MDENKAYQLLQELLSCHAPAGREAEVDAVLQRELAQFGDRIRLSQDGAGNLIAHLPGDGPRVLVLAHKDEISMAVAAIREDGRLLVQNCGGSLPWKYGEGPVEIQTDSGWLRAILSVGSSHARTGPVAELVKERALTWSDVTLFSGRSPRELAELGIHVGSRAVVSRERKQLQTLGHYVASYALDDRLGLVALVWALEQLLAEPPALDLHFVFSSSEEIGLLGAIHAAQQLRPEIAIAIDTSPVAHGSGAVLDARPIIWSRELVYHDPEECAALLRLAASLGFGAQAVLYDGAASDAAGIKKAGLAGRTVAFGFPRDNSHGFEIAHRAALPNVTQLLVAYLRQLR
ncbi:MAG: hypothetical protein OXF83_10520 [Anaerolineaceae bacterium]|nr:hypothetical protein [Anaerolineaceae bacterium]MCY3935492.1 hypothetical protein [Chloroflexota bacterium]MCY4009094.1 hypothetical protein [Anaerolineaceae bacterium]